MGRKLPPFPDEWANDAHRVPGCQSRVWMEAVLRDGTLYFAGVSDAAIVSGLIALLLRVYSGRSPEEILATDPVFLKDLGLLEALSTNRGNGIAAMARKVREVAACNRRPDAPWRRPSGSPRSWGRFSPPMRSMRSCRCGSPIEDCRAGAIGQVLGAARAAAGFAPARAGAPQPIGWAGGGRCCSWRRRSRRAGAVLCRRAAVAAAADRGGAGRGRQRDRPVGGLPGAGFGAGGPDRIRTGARRWFGDIHGRHGGGRLAAGRVGSWLVPWFRPPVTGRPRCSSAFCRRQPGHRHRLGLSPD